MSLTPIQQGNVEVVLHRDWRIELELQVPYLVTIDTQVGEAFLITAGWGFQLTLSTNSTGEWFCWAMGKVLTLY